MTSARASGLATLPGPEGSPSVVRPTRQPSLGRPRAFVYVQDVNRVIFFGARLTRQVPDLQLAGPPPSAIAAAGGSMAVGYDSGDLAVVDIRNRAQTARASLAELKQRAFNGDLILDELSVVTPTTLVVAGRFADARYGYRGFLSFRRMTDLSVIREEVLPPALGVIQDLAVTGAAVRLLLGDGRIYDVGTRRVANPGVGSAAQELRYGPGGAQWIGSGGARPGLLTPAGVFVPLAAGAVTDIVPVTKDVAVALTTDPPQVWMVTRSGRVQTRTSVDTFPYDGELVDAQLYILSTQGRFLQVLDARDLRLTQRVRVGDGLQVGRLD